ncbi:MAG TPA: hypothetical protein DDX39_08580 [Bacteroidales bacterium]|nr:MAG: hypothetical protein A2W98_04595 [Bacteroidetes bacterium GWF2_33_38]OFY73245.1 MAG: hypothetical protein A2265_09325 [Bacteroidetes bacterium RIFOXYA12_FULL_33_9]HBF88683.1 hypothetical protein [Bacteroidales bacterium]
MYKIVFTIILFFVYVKSFSQTELYDANLTDIHGNTYSIFEELNANKIIVFDFFSYYCETCRENSSRVDSIWQNNGGSDSVWIWGIETGGYDSSMIENFAALFGTSFPSFSTQNGINLPTQEPHTSLYDMFNIGGTPTYIVVCPNQQFRRYYIDSLQIGINNCRNVVYSSEPSVISKSKILNLNSYNEIKIEFYIPTISNIEFILYDMLGKEKLRFFAKFSPGINQTRMNRNNIPNGIYMLKFVVNNQEIESKKILIR